MVASAALLLTAGACSQELNAADAERDASAVVRGDLRSGATGEDAAALTEEYIGLEGVIGTSGDEGRQVLVLMGADADDAQVEAVRQRLEAEEQVERVTVERR